MMNLLSVLFKKEVLDASRDKRSVMAGLYYAIGTPILMCLLFSVMLKQFASPEDLQITIKNAEQAPNLVQYLESKEIVHGTGEDVKEIVLEISDEYAEKMSEGRPATVTVIADKSNDKLRKSITRLELALGRYNAEVASLRLLARGGYCLPLHNWCH